MTGDKGLVELLLELHAVPWKILEANVAVFNAGKSTLHLHLVGGLVAMNLAFSH